MRILIADDDGNLRKVIATELRYEGLEVTEAGSGERALELLAEGKYDVMLLDLRMPDCSGMEVLTRTMELETDVKVIVLTGCANTAAAADAVKAGAFAYLTKPFSMEELKLLIQKAGQQGGALP